MSTTEEYVSTVRQKLTCEAAQMAYDAYVEVAKVPRSVAAVVQMTAEGMTGKPLGWYRTSMGLLEMSAAGRPFARAILQRFAENVAPEEATKASKWVSVIDLYALGDSATREEVQFKLEAIAEARNLPVESVEAAWQDLMRINPSSEAFRRMTPYERMAYIEEKLRGR